MSEEEVVVRKAVLADYDDILAISDNIYGGLDYIPNMLKQYMHTTSYTPYVAVVGGQIVSISYYLHVFMLLMLAFYP